MCNIDLTVMFSLDNIESMKNEIDPKIKLSRALQLFKNNQSRLAKELGISRSIVNSWLAQDYKLVPPIHAYRLREMHPKFFKSRAK